MRNLAGIGTEEATAAATAELDEAGIPKITFTVKLPGEVDARVLGQVGPWCFERSWVYWVATGPGIPPLNALMLHAEHGKVVRVEGHCQAPNPIDYKNGFAIGLYHVDSVAGLRALARTIRKVEARDDHPFASPLPQGTGKGGRGDTPTTPKPAIKPPAQKPRSTEGYQPEDSGDEGTPVTGNPNMIHLKRRTVGNRRAYMQGYLAALVMFADNDRVQADADLFQWVKGMHSAMKMSEEALHAKEEDQADESNPPITVTLEGAAVVEQLADMVEKSSSLVQYLADEMLDKKEIRTIIAALLLALERIEPHTKGAALGMADRGGIQTAINHAREFLNKIDGEENKPAES